MNEINKISGRRLTFYQLIKEYKLQIPIIQRDYAHGRPSENEVRDTFLDALYMYLDENKPNRDLDFIYGNQFKIAQDDELKFIPLDGQQRLTTLFLLHWYLASKEVRIGELRNVLVDFKNIDNPKSRFSYETRTSSREFCDSLLNNNIDISNLLESDEGFNNSLSKTIKNERWFYMSWQADPTIQSMLFMLDVIHQKFQKSTGFFDRLINIDNPVITFQFLDLREFNLTDDLYIKMNARGIPLSPFENFKARFEQFIKKSEFNICTYKLDFNGEKRIVDLKKYFSHKIDTEWTYLFWNHTEDDRKKFDKIIMNFIRAIIINTYAPNLDIETIRYMIDKKNDNISFHQYNIFNILKISNIENKEIPNRSIDQKIITDLISILDLLKNANLKVKTYLSDFFYYDERDTFECVINNNFIQAGYVERIKFHSYCQYLIRWKTEEGFHDIDGLKNWMRIIHNLSENTAPYNNEKEFINSLIAINNLIPYSNQVHEYIIRLDKIDGFDNTQFFEEKLKINLILKNPEWKELIFLIEKHGYFKGQIGFILFLCGIEEYFQQNFNCNWSEPEDIQFKEKFKIYCDRAKLIFDDYGLIKDLDKPNFIWARSLLAVEDYLITEGSNQSFLINSDRDISWKRMLKRDKKPSEHGELIKVIFNKVNESSIIEPLNILLNSYKTNDWKRKFIQLPQLLDYLGPKRYIRKQSNHGFVLFSGERMSGSHAELFSLAFYYENLKDNKIEPFKNTDYYFADSDDVNDRPCAFIDNWQYNSSRYAINIIYSYDHQEYLIRFFYRETGDYNDDIKNILETNDFQLINASYEIYLPEHDVMQKIRVLCESLKELIELNV